MAHYFTPGADARLPVETERIMLERMRVTAEGRVSEELIASATLNAVLDIMADQLVLRLTAEVLGHHRQRYVVTFPATPWDHLKARLVAWAREHRWRQREGLFRRFRWPQPIVRSVLWWSRRHPVRESAKVIDEYATFPRSTMRYPDSLGPVVVLQRPGPGDWGEG